MTGARALWAEGRKYRSLARASLNRSLAYRGATALSLATGLIWVTMQYYLWRTVFGANARVAGFDWDRMRTYIFVSFAVNALLSFSSELRIFATIRTGDVALELLRPTDYMLAQLAQSVGAAVVEGAVTGTAVLVGGVTLLAVRPPASAGAAALFLLSVGLGFVVRFLLSYLTALLCFRVLNVQGLLWARAAVTNVLSGAMFPLALLPPVLRSFALGLPFQAVLATPLGFYLGELRGWTAAGRLGLQVLWVVVLGVSARLLWAPSARALTVHGG